MSMLNFYARGTFPFARIVGVVGSLCFHSDPGMPLLVRRGGAR